MRDYYPWEGHGPSRIGFRAPKKEEAEEIIVEVQEESGIIKSCDEARGFGFIEASDGALVGFWFKDQEGDKSLVVGKKRPVMFKRDPKAVSPRAKEWRLVPNNNKKPVTPKAAKRSDDTIIRIRVRYPDGSEETVVQDNLRRISGIFPRAPVERHDPINKLRHDYGQGGKLADVWFEELIDGVWVRCDKDPRAPNREQRRHKKRPRR